MKIKSAMSQPTTPKEPSDELRLAREIRDACAEAAKEGFQDASIQGLCQEGAMEAAVSAIERLDLKTLLKKRTSS